VFCPCRRRRGNARPRRRSTHPISSHRDPCIISGSKTADANVTLDFGARAVILQGTLTMAALGDNSVGSLTINARSFAISGPGQIRGFSSSASGGSVTINATDTITINDTSGSGAVRLSGQDGGELTLITTSGASPSAAVSACSATACPRPAAHWTSKPARPSPSPAGSTWKAVCRAAEATCP
jgi:hypothetical protein